MTIKALMDEARQNSLVAEWPEIEKGTELMLMVTELAEAMEGERKDLMDTHLPHRRMAEVELADLMIRAADYAAKWGYDLQGAIVEKLAYNRERLDHRPEHRAQQANAKQY